MTQEQREEIERAQKSSVCHDFTDQYLEPLTRFARQQLILRVDGEKMTNWLNKWYKCCDAMPTQEEWQALIMECLTTEEKE